MSNDPIISTNSFFTVRKNDFFVDRSKTGQITNMLNGRHASENTEPPPYTSADVPRRHSSPSVMPIQSTTFSELSTTVEVEEHSVPELFELKAKDYCIFCIFGATMGWCTACLLGDRYKVRL